MMDVIFIGGGISLIVAIGALWIASRSAIRFEHARHCAQIEDKQS
ncbi:hypothetical protein [Sphingobium sp. SCG-1]|nr:hypothetical protein [Sphingobium sp. SCG-1]